MLRGDTAGGQAALVDALKALLERDDFVWRGVYDDGRFDRHARGYVRKLIKMARANDGWADLRRYHLDCGIPYDPRQSKGPACGRIGRRHGRPRKPLSCGVTACT